MSTRIGKFIFEEDLEKMSVEKLDALAQACDFYKKKQRFHQLEKEFTELNLRAHVWGFDLCYVNPDDPDDLYILNQFTFSPITRETLPNGANRFDK